MKLVAFLVLGLLVFSCENEKKLSVKEIENQAAFEKQKHKRSLEISEDCLALKNILKNRETAAGKEISLHGAFSIPKGVDIYQDNTTLVYFNIGTMPYFSCYDYNDFGAKLYSTLKLKVGKDKLNIHIPIKPGVKGFAPNSVEIDTENLMIYDDDGNGIRTNEYVKAVFKIMAKNNPNIYDLELQLLSIEQQPETL